MLQGTFMCSDQKIPNPVPYTYGQIMKERVKNRSHLLKTFWLYRCKTSYEAKYTGNPLPTYSPLQLAKQFPYPLSSVIHINAQIEVTIVGFVNCAYLNCGYCEISPKIQMIEAMMQNDLS